MRKENSRHFYASPDPSTTWNLITNDPRTNIEK